MESSKSNSAYFFDSHPFVSIDLFLASEHCSSCFFFFEYANLSYNFTNLVLLTLLSFFSMVDNVFGWGGGGRGEGGRVLFLQSPFVE